MLEEVTADTENLGAVEVTVSVGLLATTNDDVAGNETVSFCALMLINIHYQKVMLILLHWLCIYFIHQVVAVLYMLNHCQLTYAILLS